MKHIRLARATILCSLLFMTAPASAAGSEEDTLRALLDSFLANVATIEAHERFWADDLVYTSSNGSRTDKNAILAGMREAAAQVAGDEGPTYSAKDVDIRVYGQTAIVAFRLVAVEPGAAGAVSSYFNTGTFLQRNGQWQAVAWQATRIPEGAQEP